MRTTIEIEDDVLSGLKSLSRKRGVTLGQVVSELARRSLHEQAPQKVRNGVLLFASKTKSAKSDMEVVNALRDEG
jgi:predicted DNA-binding ribbon-helix-helix protein